MTPKDVTSLLLVLQTEWPQSFKGQTPEDIKRKASLWSEMFADDDLVLVLAAVKAIIVAGTREFAPNVGQIKEQMRKLTEREGMTELEAWAIVKKAISRSAYNAKAEYGKLPPTLQRLVGSSGQLRDWAMMDSETLDSVIASNFQRSYKVRAKAEAEYQAIPESVRKAVEGVVSRLALQEG